MDEHIQKWPALARIFDRCCSKSLRALLFFTGKFHPQRFQNITQDVAASCERFPKAVAGSLSSRGRQPAGPG